MNYPDLKNSKIISYDIETFDPNLIKMGPGIYRDDGRILGISIADENGFSEYYNIGHKGVNIEEKKKNIQYIREQLYYKENSKLAVNCSYDIDWLQNWDYGIKINGPLLDIQVAEPLLDEYKLSYSLDNLAKEYLGKEKFKTEIENFCKEKELKGDPRQYLYLMPYELVKKYAIEDSILPIEIWKKQKEKIIEQDLLDLFKLEMRLFPLLLHMRKTGVKINTKLLQESKEQLETAIILQKKEVYSKYGRFNYNSSNQIANIFNKLNLQYSVTAKGNPSFSKEELEKCEHEIAKDILDIRHKEKIFSTFLQNSLTDHVVNGRIHTSFYPMKTDMYGTKSGRFSSANPNLQQIPAKDDSISKLCRRLFIPEENCYWGKVDYSQIEYRLIAHYASGPKSDEIKKQYNEDPNTDYHQLVMDWTGTDRKTAKNLNFGMAYAMGVKTCTRKFGWSIEESTDLINTYHKLVPFVKYTLNQVSNIARGRGYIRTILNRRARLSAHMREEGKEYTMFNRLIQGSAADIMKKAMVDCWEAGIFNILYPHLTVHDELDVSIPNTKEGIEAFCEMKYLMEQTIKLKVPIIADAEMGNNWADCTEEKFNSIKKENNL